MSHPNPKFGQIKCARHADAHCYECYPVTTAPTSESAPSIEDAIVGRSTTQSSAPAKPPASEPLAIPVAITTILAPTSEPPKLDDSPAALVKASQTYADAVAAAEKAVSIVADLERRLEFARENAVEAINAKDESLKRIKVLIGENHE
jgi:hypothetical protein